MSEQALMGLAADDESAVESDVSTNTDDDESDATETETQAGEAGSENADEETESEDDDEAPDWAEVEVNGQTYKVHPDLREGYIQQADYTRKTQEVAEQRRVIEARETQLQESAQSQMAHIGEIAAIQNAQSILDAFEQVDWNTLYEQDPAEASRLSHQQQAATKAKADAEENYKQSRDSAFQVQQVELAKAQEKCREDVKKNIPGWSDEMDRDVTNYALGLGYTEQALRSITRSQDIETLCKAFKYDQLQAKQSKAKPKLKPGDIAPTKAVKAKRSAAKTGLHDNLSMDEWVRRRERQLAER